MNRYRSDRRASDHVYFAVARNGKSRNVKIGITCYLRERMNAIRGDLIFAIRCDNPTARELELALHDTFAQWRFEGTEWFAANEQMWQLITKVLHLGYWPWTHDPIIRGENW